MLPSSVRILGLFVLAWAAFGAVDGPELAKALLDAGLDPAECYRIRDLSLAKEDLRLYFTDGYLIFGRPVEGVRTSAVFFTELDVGDAEVLLLPPSKSERQSLASFTGSPNLAEHFKSAVFVFSDDSATALIEQIRSSESNKKVPEMGLAVESEWRSVVRNLAASFESRLVLDLLSPKRTQKGFFFGAVLGNQLGNIDLIHDPRAAHQITVGKVNYRDQRPYFDTLTAFESRSIRNLSRTQPARARDEVELKDYRISTVLQPPDLRLKVVTKVKLRPTSSGERALPFDVSRQMRITEAFVDGRPAGVLQHESMRSNLIRNNGNDLFLLFPPEPLEAGREYEIEFRHEGAVISEAGNRVYFVGARGNWFPGRGFQYAHYDLTFRYPKDLVLVSTGELVSEDVEDDFKITRRRTSVPVRLAGFNLGDYEMAKVARGGQIVEVYANRGVERALQPRPHVVIPPPQAIWPRMNRREMQNLPVETSFLPPDPLGRLRELAGEVASALEFMSARFGPPPIRTLTVSPLPGAIGQGFPGLIYLSTLSYLSPNDRPISRMGQNIQLFFREILHSHETAHQWWGNLVISSGREDDWLLEALANYSALLYLEKRKGAKALETVLESYRDNLLAKYEDGRTVESAGPIVLGTRLQSSMSPGAWRTITYEKGSWILHMLRRRMGDSQFDAFLGDVRRTFEKQPLSTDQFRMLSAKYLPPKSTDPSLEGFFDQWVHSTGIPSFELRYTVRGKAPSLKLTGTVTQSAVGEDFSTIVPVEIQLGKGKSIVHWVRTGADASSFSVPLRQAPTRVSLDPTGAVLASRK